MHLAFVAANCTLGDRGDCRQWVGSAVRLADTGYWRAFDGGECAYAKYPDVVLLKR